MTKMLGNLQTRLKTKQQQNLKNKMEKIIHLLMFNYIFAIISIIFGIWKLRDTIKNTTRDTNSALQPFLSGIVGSIAFIVLGFIIIYFKIKGKL